jgi:hypothetical protein
MAKIVSDSLHFLADLKLCGRTGFAFKFLKLENLSKTYTHDLVGSIFLTAKEHKFRNVL